MIFNRFSRHVVNWIVGVLVAQIAVYASETVQVDSNLDLPIRHEPYEFYVQRINDSVNDLFEAYILRNAPLSPSAAVRPFKEPLLVEGNGDSTQIFLSIRDHYHENNLFSFRTRAFCYSSRCSVPGPTISLDRGLTHR
jgi:hypothetical protein